MRSCICCLENQDADSDLRQFLRGEEVGKNVKEDETAILFNRIPEGKKNKKGNILLRRTSLQVLQQLNNATNFIPSSFFLYLPLLFFLFSFFVQKIACPIN